MKAMRELRRRLIGEPHHDDELSEKAAESIAQAKQVRSRIEYLRRLAEEEDRRLKGA